MKVSDLRGILQYIPRFRDRIFVISVDGAVVASDNFSNILLDLAVLRSLNIKVILVHGAGYQIDQLAEERGITLPNSDGSGVTDEATLKLSIDAATRLTSVIMQGLTSVDLRTAHANAIIAHPAGVLKGVDHLYTGRVERVDTHSLEVLLKEGIIPVIPPIGFDGAGSTYRINSDAIAVAVGQAIKAAKVLFLTPDEGLSIDGEAVHQLSIKEAEALVKRPAKIDSASLSSKLTHAAKACRHGVPRVHLLQGHMDEALLAEIFSNEGVGTMVYSNEYQQIRPMLKRDVRNVMALIRQSVKNEELVRRRRADLVAKVSDYYVLEVDGNIVGCVALVPYPAENAAELACLYVNQNHADEGYGRKLIAFTEETAAAKGFKSLFALSTQAYKYFIQQSGFTEVEPAALPKARHDAYLKGGRKSKVLHKELTPPSKKRSAPRS